MTVVTKLHYKRNPFLLHTAAILGGSASAAKQATDTTHIREFTPAQFTYDTTPVNGNTARTPTSRRSRAVDSAARRAGAVHRISIVQRRSTPSWAKVRDKSGGYTARFSLSGDADISRHTNRQLFSRRMLPVRYKKRANLGIVY